MKPTLLIMAAGIGSRYGGIKQLEGFGPGGETIVDYSVYDAVKAGFGTVVFVIQKAIETESRALFERRFGDRIKVEFVCQELTSLVPPEFTQSTQFSARTKPWGTGQAVLVARDLVQTPFAVINADDFYGPDGLQTIGDFLRTDVSEVGYAMVGYQLRNTLSEHGTVSRGICEVDDSGQLIDIVEHTKVRKVDDHAESVGESEAPVPLTGEESVSMNLWGFHPSFFHHLEQQFTQFLHDRGMNPDSEFYIPAVVNQLIKERTVTVKVLPIHETWFGVTYQEDVPVVRQKIAEKIAAGVYPERLWR